MADASNYPAIEAAAKAEALETFDKFCADLLQSLNRVERIMFKPLIPKIRAEVPNLVADKLDKKLTQFENMKTSDFLTMAETLLAGHKTAKAKGLIDDWH